MKKYIKLLISLILIFTFLVTFVSATNINMNLLTSDYNNTSSSTVENNTVNSVNNENVNSDNNNLNEANENAISENTNTAQEMNQRVTSVTTDSNEDFLNAENILSIIIIVIGILLILLAYDTVIYFFGNKLLNYLTFML